MNSSELTNAGSQHAGRPQPGSYQTARQAFRLLRCCWGPLVLTDVVFKILAFVVLTPIVAIACRLFVEFSGRTVLADADILVFFISPVGWLCFIAAGGLWLAIVALEQAALLHVLHWKSPDGRFRVIEALRFALSHIRPVLGLTVRIAAFTLLTAFPFLAATGVVYLALLNQHDINYYLSEKPPVFWQAVSCGAVILGTLAIVLLRLFSGWLFSLPLLLFERLGVVESLRVSRVLANGQRIRLIAWLAGWMLVTTIMSAIGTGAVGLLGQLTIPHATTSLPLLLFAVGGMVIVWSIITVAVNLLSTASFAALLFSLYASLGRERRLAEPLAKDADRDKISIGLELTWSRLLLGALAGVIGAMTVGIVMLNTIQLEDNTEITAHRGASASAPENTLAAVKAAIEQGADWIEIDVQETADGHVVVFHDSDFKRVAGTELKIWEATLDDLQDLDIGSWFSSEYKDERVPTLEQVLETCKGKAGVNIELKYYGHDVRLEERVIETVEAHDMESAVVVMSLKLQAVQKMRKLKPSWQVGLLTAVAVGNLKRVDADFFAVSAGIATRDFIKATHGTGKQVHVWTINDTVTMSTMIGRAADNLITDEPALARAVLEERAELGVPERVLLGVAELFGVAPKFSQQ